MSFFKKFKEKMLGSTPEAEETVSITNKFKEGIIQNKKPIYFKGE